MTLASASRTEKSTRRTIIGGTLITLFLTLGVGGWAATTELAGAVIASGSLVVDSSVKKVQHLTGGVVSELFVRDGMFVREGEILLRLDETIARASLSIITKGMDELAARQARLKSEQDGSPEIIFPKDLLSRSEQETQRLLNDERRLFQSRHSARGGQRSQLGERISQLKEQIQGMMDQALAKLREMQLLEQELIGVRALWQKNLVQMSRVTALERDGARLQGERGSLLSNIAQVKGKITETELQIIQIDQDHQSEVGKELADIRGKLAELAEKRIAAEDLLKRIDIRSPQDGIVHQLAFHTVGGVIGPSETIMTIVPGKEILTVEVRVSPQDIDQVQTGQPAVIRFLAFNQRTTPELKGFVNFVSADITIDQRSGGSFYFVRVQPISDDLDRYSNMKLKPGMPVESYIQTGDRTVWSYLTKPLSDQLSRTWRER